VATVVGGLLALYWQTAASIVAIWWRSETFAHGFVVVPICAWLVWRKRNELAQIPARPWWPGLGAVFLAGALWFVMSKANVLGVKQFALAFMIQASIVTVLGLRVSRVLLFPLAFLLFAIPAGEFLVPTLMDWTADFTVASIRWSGVPVYREANHFTLPTGNWSIVEACSGVRYLIASVMVGTIYAALAYRSARHRVAFVAASILVPIVANWLRAYGIVMIGHLSNNRLAVGVDHIIYGWLFFGVVMLILFWIGSFWEERPLPSDAHAAAPPGVAVSPVSHNVLFGAAFASILAAGVWWLVDADIDRPVATVVPVIPAIAGADGWVAEPGPVTDFKPHYLGAAAVRQQSFRKGERDVGLYLAFYRAQEKGRELVTSGNMVVTPENLQWALHSVGSDTVQWTGNPVRTYAAELSGPAETRLQVFRLYWVNGRVTASDYFAKALMAWSNITGRGDDSALIIFYAPVPARGDEARSALRSFAAANSAAIEQALEAAQRTPR
jgi:exosortase A